MATIAERQHGVIARRQLLALGMTPSMVTRWVAVGHLHRLHRGVYAVGHRRITQEGAWMAAAIACGPRAALSHAPAGQLTGFVDRWERHALHVSLSGRGCRRPPRIVLHRPRRLEPVDLTRRLGIPVTSPTRTVWDLASTAPPRSVRRYFERVDGRGNLDRARMAALLAASASRRGAGLIRELLGNRPLPLSEVRTWLEELLMHVCADHGLPLPAINVPLLGYEVDFLWPAARFVVEADGGDHLDPEQRDSDNERDFALARAGYLVRRYSYKAMNRERQVAREVSETLAKRLSI